MLHQQFVDIGYKVAHKVTVFFLILLKITEFTQPLLVLSIIPYGR